MRARNSSALGWHEAPGGEERCEKGKGRKPPGDAIRRRVPQRPPGLIPAGSLGRLCSTGHQLPSDTGPIRLRPGPQLPNLPGKAALAPVANESPQEGPSPAFIIRSHEDGSAQGLREELGQCLRQAIEGDSKSSHKNVNADFIVYWRTQ